MIHEYRHKRRVQFHETDKAGIVHFSNYFRYLEEAEHALWRAAGLSIAPAKAQIGWPRVAASFEYKRPLQFEDEFEMHIWISAKSRKSITYTAKILLAGQEVARGQLTIACVRHTPDGTMQAVEIPPEVDALLQVAPDNDAIR